MSHEPLSGYEAVARGAGWHNIADFMHNNPMPAPHYRDYLGNRLNYMNFSEALTAIKHGEKLMRSGWNGKNMFIFYCKRGFVSSSDTGPYANDDVENVTLQPFIAMMTVQQTVVPWLCSQTDMLAEDWEVVR